MRERVLIHVAGPQGAGKTTFIEAVLEPGGLILAARCVRDDSLRRSREDTPTSHPELRRYRAAGACGAALFTFPESETGSDAFFVTHLMEDYSEATILEGDNPLGFVDLVAFVAPPLPAGKTLLVRRRRDRAKEERDRADALERVLREPDGVARLLEQMAGAPLAAFARKRPELLEKTRADLLAGIVRGIGAGIGLWRGVGQRAVGRLRIGLVGRQSRRHILLRAGQRDAEDTARGPQDGGCE
jgi:hypothetical protein